MSHFELPEPVRELTEELLRWNCESCQQVVNAHLSLLSPDEQLIIFDVVMDAVQNDRTLLMYVDGRSGRGKTLKTLRSSLPQYDHRAKTSCALLPLALLH